MGNSKAIFGLFLAIGFGVMNGIAVFGPALQKQKEEEKDDFAVKHGAGVFGSQFGSPDPKQLSEKSAVVLDSAEKPATSNIQGSDLKAQQKEQGRSWWRGMSAWSKGGGDGKPGDGK